MSEKMTKTERLKKTEAAKMDQTTIQTKDEISIGLGKVIPPKPPTPPKSE